MDFLNQIFQDKNRDPHWMVEHYYLLQEETSNRLQILVFAGNEENAWREGFIGFCCVSYLNLT